MPKVKYGPVQIFRFATFTVKPEPFEPPREAQGALKLQRSLPSRPSGGRIVGGTPGQPIVEA